MPDRIVYVIGDSHSEMLRTTSKELGLSNLIFRPFGAVKQSINQHHRLSPDGRSIQLLEENWREKSLPFSSEDLKNQNVRYYISLPFNVFPLLRRIDTHKFTISPQDSERAYLSKAAQEALFARRNKLSIALIADMIKIGLKVTAIESPRPFADAPISQTDNDTIVKLSNRYYANTRDRLVAAGAGVVRQPNSTIDETGQTLAEYRRPEDNQHGNRVFYEMVLRDVLSDAGISA